MNSKYELPGQERLTLNPDEGISQSLISNISQPFDSYNEKFTKKTSKCTCALKACLREYILHYRGPLVYGQLPKID